MRWLIASEFSINIARGIFTLAIGMLLYEQSESLWAFALVFASEFAIGLFLQGLAGTIVDRHGPARVLLIAAAASVVVLAVPLFLLASLNTQSLIIIALGLNIFRPFIRNAIFTISPELVSKDKLEKLNAYISIALQSGQIIGMALAGLLLELFAPVWTIQAVFLGYLGALVCYCLTTLDLNRQNRINSASKATAGNSARSKGSWAEVARFIRSHTGAMYLYLIATIDYMALGLFNLLLAPAVKHNFDNLPRWLTFIDGSFAAGAILGGLLVAKRQLNTLQRLQLTTMSMAMAALIYIGYGAKWSVWLIMLFTFAFGILTTTSTVAWMSAQQRLAPDHIKGRLASVRYIANACFASAATLMVAWANDFGLAEASFTAAGCVVLMLLAAWVFRPVSATEICVNKKMESAPGEAS